MTDRQTDRQKQGGKNNMSPDLPGERHNKRLAKRLKNKYMYGLKIACTDQVSFGPVFVLMVVRVIWSSVFSTVRYPFLLTSRG